ncbi:hypothetical protein BC939DRAFT_48793 [Gamsiella multidivaricata]|uniref:uncharacterized protein n=1 Tax=Gamsiella multidivaricata TaxID=101098 RepID=UPI0022206C37|nr:uncharacterized protein BC939DRAFT_48793 [Gamsiella multidivaricata]KAI7828724.1 hypothetical protein BC939DRAFT_48793 [Gamsiella multidivaricata]
MFNTLLKKASESSFAALASEALDSRPGSPAPKRPPGSPLAGQQQNGANSPARKPRNPNARASASNPHSTNAQLSSQLDEAYTDIEAFQKMLQKAAQEKSEISKDADQLREENESLNEELQEARAVIKAMRATLEDKATDEFLSPKLTAEKGSQDVQGDRMPNIVTASEDPLGAMPVKESEKPDIAPSSASAASVEPVPATSTTSPDTNALESKLKDLTQQLSARTGECHQLEDTLTQKTSELGKQKSDHDEKMKKMKAIFAAANKNLNEYRQSIAAKDEEIAELKNRLDNPQLSEEQKADQNQAIQELETELRTQSELAGSKLQQMVRQMEAAVTDILHMPISTPHVSLTVTIFLIPQESKYRQTNTQLEKLKVEYQQYKQRASALLQQQREAVQSDDDNKLKELQNQLEVLTKENRQDHSTASTMRVKPKHIPGRSSTHMFILFVHSDRLSVIFRKQSPRNQHWKESCSWQWIRLPA